MIIKRNSENQISCTITANELSERQLSVGSISYGSKHAKELIKEIMQIAKKEIGFVSDNLPLVVEIVPTENDGLTFIITKAEYPEELDARFSRFTPADENEYPPVDASEMDFEDATTSIFKHLESLANEMEEESDDETEVEVDTSSKAGKASPKAPPYMIYSFDSMEDLISLAKLLSSELPLPSSVYRTGQGNTIHLLVSPGESNAEKFKSICEVISEYSSKDRRLKGSDLLLKEHYKPVIQNDALEVLSKL